MWHSLHEPCGHRCVLHLCVLLTLNMSNKQILQPNSWFKCHLWLNIVVFPVCQCGLFSFISWIAAAFTMEWWGGATRQQITVLSLGQKHNQFTSTLEARSFQPSHMSIWNSVFMIFSSSVRYNNKHTAYSMNKRSCSCYYYCFISMSWTLEFFVSLVWFLFIFLNFNILDNCMFFSVHLSKKKKRHQLRVWSGSGCFVIEN